MPHVLVHVTVEDFDKWKPVFEEAASFRQGYGAKGTRVFRLIERPDEVMIVAEFEDIARAREMFQSPEFRALMLKGAVVGRPTVTFLEFIGDYAG